MTSRTEVSLFSKDPTSIHITKVFWKKKSVCMSVILYAQHLLESFLNESKFYLY